MLAGRKWRQNVGTRQELEVVVAIYGDKIARHQFAPPPQSFRAVNSKRWHRPHVVVGFLGVEAEEDDLVIHQVLLEIGLGHQVQAVGLLRVVV